MTGCTLRRLVRVVRAVRDRRWDTALLRKDEGRRREGDE